MLVTNTEGDIDVTLPMAACMEANALIDRLVSDDADTFDAAEASRLLQLIPCARRHRWLSFAMRGQLPGGTTKGIAAGVGAAEVENGRRSFEVNFNGERVWRIGGYKVSHHPGELAIRLMMDIDPLSDEECFLVYRAPDNPLRLERATKRWFTLPLGRLSFNLSIPGRLVWKWPKPQT